MTKVDYGLDAPGVVRGFAIAGALLAVATVVLDRGRAAGRAGAVRPVPR